MKEYNVGVMKQNCPDSHYYSNYCTIKLRWTSPVDPKVFWEDIKERFPYPEFLLELDSVEETREIIGTNN